MLILYLFLKKYTRGTRLVYKILYCRARSWPRGCIGRVRASKGILYTRQVLGLKVKTAARPSTRPGRRYGILYTTTRVNVYIQNRPKIKMSFILISIKWMMINHSILDYHVTNFNTFSRWL